MSVDVAGQLPAGEQGWQLLFELAEENDTDWLLIGGQMMFLLSAAYGSRLARATVDMDVVVDVRARPGGTRWLAEWLIERGFEQDKPSANGISHRFSRPVEAGPGRVVFDVLGPDGVGRRTDLTTSPPGRTVQTPGASQAFTRCTLVDVQLHCADGKRLAGRVRCPDLLGALVLKAAAVSEIAVRQDPDRDWQDCALLLSIVPDPFALANLTTPRDRRRMRHLQPLTDRNHIGWSTLDDEAHRRGITALESLISSGHGDDPLSRNDEVSIRDR